MSNENKKQGWFWPEIKNLGNAKEASRLGFWAAIVVASATTIFATIALELVPFFCFFKKLKFKNRFSYS